MGVQGLQSQISGVFLITNAQVACICKVNKQIKKSKHKPNQNAIKYGSKQKLYFWFEKHGFGYWLNRQDFPSTGLPEDTECGWKI